MNVLHQDVVITQPTRDMCALTACVLRQEFRWRHVKVALERYVLLIENGRIRVGLEQIENELIVIDLRGHVERGIATEINQIRIGAGRQ